MSNSIILYGTGTRKFNYCYRIIKEFVTYFYYNISIEKSSSVNEMLQLGIAGIPAFTLNNRKALILSENESVEAFLLRCIEQIIKYVPNRSLKYLLLPYGNSSDYINKMRYILNQSVSYALIVVLRSYNELVEKENTSLDQLIIINDYSKDKIVMDRFLPIFKAEKIFEHPNLLTISSQEFEDIDSSVTLSLPDVYHKNIRL